MAWTSPRWRLATVLLGATSAVAACGGDDDSACGPITRESLDPAYLVHVLGNEEGVEYTSDPPTSGPHQPGPPVDGVVGDPIALSVQVGILERGDVLLQHDPDLDEEALTALEGLAGARVVVAPNPDLPDPVVATAWLFKRSCQAVEVTALQEFVAERVGQGPEG